MFSKDRSVICKRTMFSCLLPEIKKKIDNLIGNMNLELKVGAEWSKAKCD